MKYHYKNISKQEQLLIGVPGPISSGSVFEADSEINNSNFERVKGKTPKTKEDYSYNKKS